MNMQEIELFNKVRDEIEIKGKKNTQHIKDVQNIFKKPKEFKHEPYVTNFIKHLTSKKQSNIVTMQEIKLFNKVIDEIKIRKFFL